MVKGVDLVSTISWVPGGSGGFCTLVWGLVWGFYLGMGLGMGFLKRKVTFLGFWRSKSDFLGVF